MDRTSEHRVYARAFVAVASYAWFGCHPSDPPEHCYLAFALANYVWCALESLLPTRL